MLEEVLAWEKDPDRLLVMAEYNFEVINVKLDRLMQIVALTEKKPSV